MASKKPVTDRQTRSRRKVREKHKHVMSQINVVAVLQCLAVQTKIARESKKIMLIL